jgi:hypothetical protein
MRKPDCDALAGHLELQPIMWFMRAQGTLTPF